MRRVLPILVLATGLLGGCKADKTSRASSQFDENTAPAQPGVQTNAPTALTPAAPPPPHPSLQPKSPNDPRPVIVCFGDSLTEGYGADTGQSYPDFLQADLDQAGYHYRVLNEGVSGNTSKDGVDRLRDVVQEHPDLVLVEFGGNDGLRGVAVPTLRNNLARIIQTLQAAGIKVILLGITLPPDYGPDYVKAFTQTYPMLAKRFDVPLFPFLLKDVYGVRGLMQQDNIHATDQGNKIVAANVLPVLEPLLKK